MKHLIRLSFLALALIASPLVTTSVANVINFDDLGDGVGPSPYQGFNWDPNFQVYDQDTYQLYYDNTVDFPSYANAVFNSVYGAPNLVVTFGDGSTPFNFVGAYFAGFAYDDSAASYTASSITVSGYDLGTLVGSTTITLPTANFTWLDANLDDITSLVISDNGPWGKYWLMDNFTYSTASQVPDFSNTMILFSIAVIGFAVAAKQKSRSRPRIAAVRL